MAVYKRTYHGYDGRRTPAWRRAWVIHTYARQRVFSSRLLTALFLICLLIPLFQLTAVYLANNFAFLSQLGGLRALVVDNQFFSSYLHYQCVVAFLFTAFAAPGLIAPDVAHGGLSLYLARPLNRWEYVAGKFSVLALLLSCLTWIPALVVFLVQYNLGGASWQAQYGWLGWALVVAGGLWIAVLSLLALAVSAWVKWRVLAAGALLAIEFLGAGLGAAVNATLGTQAGDLFNFNQVHVVVWSGWFRLTPLLAPGLVAAAWLVLAAVAGLSLWLIAAKVRPLAVVR